MRRPKLKGAPSTDYVCYAFMVSICDMHENEACGDWKYFTHHACEDDMYSGATKSLPSDRCIFPIDVIPEETSFMRMQHLKPAQIRKINGQEYERISEYPLTKDHAYNHMRGVKNGGFPAAVICHRGHYWVYRKSNCLES